MTCYPIVVKLPVRKLDDDDGQIQNCISTVCMGAGAADQ